MGYHPKLDLLALLARHQERIDAEEIPVLALEDLTDMQKGLETEIVGNLIERGVYRRLNETAQAALRETTPDSVLGADGQVSPR